MYRKLISYFFTALVTAGLLFIFGGCGDMMGPQHDPRLSDADIIAFKQWRLQQMYGSAGTTSTSTVINYVTVPNTNTVTVQQ